MDAENVARLDAALARVAELVAAREFGEAPCTAYQIRELLEDAPADAVTVTLLTNPELEPMTIVSSVSVYGGAVLVGYLNRETEREVEVDLKVGVVPRGAVRVPAGGFAWAFRGTHVLPLDCLSYHETRLGLCPADARVAPVFAVFDAASRAALKTTRVRLDDVECDSGMMSDALSPEGPKGPGWVVPATGTPYLAAP